MVYRLGDNDYEDSIRLFYECFKDNDYYESVSGNDFEKFVKEDVSRIFKYCYENGYILGEKEDNKLIGIIVSFEYRKVKDNEYMFNLIFGDRGQQGVIPYKNQLHDKIEKLNGEIRYLLCLAIDNDYRNKKLCSKMLDELLEVFKDSNFAADVTNVSTLPMYKHRGFNASKIENNYIYVYKSRK